MQHGASSFQEQQNSAPEILTRSAPESRADAGRSPDRTLTRGVRLAGAEA
ncbi:MAG: hypothetical protein K8S97_07110 [Anaerolineae bacterium]|nr:hypothetical protein [Anaerolineae bacterium]